MKFLYCTKLESQYCGYYANFKHKKQQNTDAKYCDIRTYIKLNQKSGWTTQKNGTANCAELDLK